jgi:hypothetical protein
VAMTDDELAAVLAALEKAGADPRCPSCKSTDLSGWETGAIPKVLEVDEPAPPYLEERLDAERRLIGWAHGLKVLAPAVVALRVRASATPERRKRKSRLPRKGSRASYPDTRAELNAGLSLQAGRAGASSRRTQRAILGGLRESLEGQVVLSVDLGESRS